MKREVILAGRGGQGQILAGIILAEAALKAGLNAVQTQSYGPESRGGASKAEVVLAEGEIDYPKLQNPDTLLAMSQEAADQYGPAIADHGLILLDSTLVSSTPETRATVYQLPITRMAQEDLGRAIVANIVALGALVGLTDLVPAAYLEEAVLDRVPKGTEDLNRKALNAGLAAGRALRQPGQ